MSFLNYCSFGFPIRGIPFIFHAVIDRCYALFFLTYANYTIFFTAKQIDFRTFIECRPSGDGFVPTSRGVFSCLNCDFWDLGIFRIILSECLSRLGGEAANLWNFIGFIVRIRKRQAWTRPKVRRCLGFLPLRNITIFWVLLWIFGFWRRWLRFTNVVVTWVLRHFKFGAVRMGYYEIFLSFENLCEQRHSARVLRHFIDMALCWCAKRIWKHWIISFSTAQMSIQPPKWMCKYFDSGLSELGLSGF